MRVGAGLSSRGPDFRLRYFRPELRLQVQLIHRLDEAAYVVAEDFTEDFVDLRRPCLAPKSFNAEVFRTPSNSFGAKLISSGKEKSPAQGLKKYGRPKIENVTLN